MAISDLVVVASVANTTVRIDFEATEVSPSWRSSHFCHLISFLPPTTLSCDESIERLPLFARTLVPGLIIIALQACLKFVLTLQNGARGASLD
jgi:hypothetical protein